MKIAAKPPKSPGHLDLTPGGCTAFRGPRRVAAGSVLEVARRLKADAEEAGDGPLLIFDDMTGSLVELDLRGTVAEVIKRLATTSGSRSKPTIAQPKARIGRPKLGVISREVTLLPGQWDWLETQPGGASATLRRLVYSAARSSLGKDQARQAQESVYRFMTAMAGDYPGFEEALRAFYRRDLRRFETLIQSWPKDVRVHVLKMVAIASQAAASPPTSPG
jgi:hypothetical protein